MSVILMWYKLHGIRCSNIFSRNIILFVFKKYFTFILFDLILNNKKYHQTCHRRLQECQNFLKTAFQIFQFNTDNLSCPKKEEIFST